MAVRFLLSLGLTITSSLGLRWRWGSRGGCWAWGWGSCWWSRCWSWRWSGWIQLLWGRRSFVAVALLLLSLKCYWAKTLLLKLISGWKCVCKKIHYLLPVQLVFVTLILVKYAFCNVKNVIERTRLVFQFEIPIWI